MGSKWGDPRGRATLKAPGSTNDWDVRGKGSRQGLGTGASPDGCARELVSYMVISQVGPRCVTKTTVDRVPASQLRVWWRVVGPGPQLTDGLEG